VIIGAGDGSLAVLKQDTFKILRYPTVVRCVCIADGCRQATVLGGVSSLQLFSNGSSFYCGTKQGNVYQVEYGSLNPKLIWSCHFERINDVTFANNYSKLFATASVGEIRVWNAENSQELLRIAVPNVECTCVIIPVDGKSIISGWTDGKIRAFTPQSGKAKWTINDAHTKIVTALAMTSDCTRLISGGSDGQVRIWRIGESQQMIASMKEHKGMK